MPCKPRTVFITDLSNPQRTDQEVRTYCVVGIDFKIVTAFKIEFALTSTTFPLVVAAHIDIHLTSLFTNVLFYVPLEWRKKEKSTTQLVSVFNCTYFSSNYFKQLNNLLFFMRNVKLTKKD